MKVAQSFALRLRSPKKDIGFNAATEEYVDMIEAGIVDPVKGY